MDTRIEAMAAQADTQVLGSGDRHRNARPGLPQRSPVEQNTRTGNGQEQVEAMARHTVLEKRRQVANGAAGDWPSIEVAWLSDQLHVDDCSEVEEGQIAPWDQLVDTSWIGGSCGHSDSTSFRSPDNHRAADGDHSFRRYVKGYWA